MATWIFWKDALERAFKTFAQTLLATLVVGTPLWDLNWGTGLGVSLTAAAASVLSSIASSAVGSPSSASLVNRAEH